MSNNTDEYLKSKLMDTKTKFVLKLLDNKQYKILDSFLIANNMSLNNLTYISQEAEDLFYNRHYDDFTLERFLSNCEDEHDSESKCNLYNFIMDKSGAEYLIDNNLALDNLDLQKLYLYPEILKTIFESPKISLENKKSYVKKQGGELYPELLRNEVSKDIFKYFISLGSEKNFNISEKKHDGHILGETIRELEKILRDNSVSINKVIQKISNLSQDENCDLDILKAGKLIDKINMVCEFDIDKNFNYINELRLKGEYPSWDHTEIDSIFDYIKEQKPIYNYVDQNKIKESILKGDDYNLMKQLNFLKVENRLTLSEITIYPYSNFHKGLLTGNEDLKVLKVLADYKMFDLIKFGEIYSINKKFGENKEFDSYLTTFIGNNLVKGKEFDDFLFKLKEDGLVDDNILSKINDISNSFKISLERNVIELLKKITLDDIHKKLSEKLTNDFNKQDIPKKIDDKLNLLIRKELNIDIKTINDDNFVELVNDFKINFKSQIESQIHNELRDDISTEYKKYINDPEFLRIYNNQVEIIKDMNYEDLKNYQLKLNGPDLPEIIQIPKIKKIKTIKENDLTL